MNEYSEIIKQINHKILSEDGTFKYDFMISLKDIALAKFASHLWMSQENQHAIVKHYHDLFKHRLTDFTCENLKDIEDNVVSQISTLLLPKSIIGQLKNLVPFLGKSVYNWVYHHDNYIFETKKHSKYCAADLIKYLKWTTQGKIDYAQTAKAILINENEVLTDDHKYKLACTYCLEEEITTIAPLVINLDYLANINVQDHPMVYFWTSHITNNKDIKDAYYHLHEYRGRERSHITFNEYIFWFLLCKSQIFAQILNEVPYKYLWNRLNENERAAYVPLLIKKLRNDDFKYELLSNLNKKQQAEVFKECSYTILTCILDDWLWEKYFLPTALHMLDHIKPSNYVLILKYLLIKKMSKINNELIYDQYKYFFKVLWIKRPLNVKLFMIKNDQRWLMIMIILFWERDLDIIDLICKDLDTTCKKNIILRLLRTFKCKDFIVKGQWDLLHLFTKYCHASEEELRHLKQDIIENSGINIVRLCTKNDAFENVDSFMNWAFESDEDRSEFKEKVVYQLIYTYFKFLAIPIQLNVTDLEKCLKWCSNDPTIIEQLKITATECYFFQLVSKLIEKDKYELLDQTLNWCFSGDQNRIIHFKENAYKNNDQVDSIKSLVSCLIRADMSFAKLNKFIHWCFSSAEEAQEFRKWIMHSVEHLLDAFENIQL